MRPVVMVWCVIAIALAVALANPADARCGRGLLGIRGRVADRISAQRGVLGVRGAVRAIREDRISFRQDVSQAMPDSTSSAFDQLVAIPNW